MCQIKIADKENIEKTILDIESDILTLNMEKVLELVGDKKLKNPKLEIKVIKVIMHDIEGKVNNLTDKKAIVEYLHGIKEFLGSPPLEFNTRRGNNRL